MMPMKVFRNVDDQALDRLELLSVFVAHYDFGLADHELKTFATHGFNENGELQFTAAEHAEGFRGFRVFDANGNVGEQFLGEAIAKIAGGEVISFAAAERAGIDGENHGESRLVDGERLQRLRIFERSDAFADLDSFNAGDGYNVSGYNAVGLIAFKASEGVKLGDFRGDELSVQLADADFLAAIESAIKHAADGQAAEKIGVVEVGDLELKHARRIARGTWNFVHDGFEQRQQILGVVADFAMRHAGASVRVDDGEIELILGGVKVDEKIVDFI